MTSRLQLARSSLPGSGSESPVVEAEIFSSTLAEANLIWLTSFWTPLFARTAPTFLESLQSAACVT